MVDSPVSNIGPVEKLSIYLLKELEKISCIEGKNPFWKFSFLDCQYCNPIEPTSIFHAFFRMYKHV
jgi:hypothetical protein